MKSYFLYTFLPPEDWFRRSRRNVFTNNKLKELRKFITRGIWALTHSYPSKVLEYITFVKLEILLAPGRPKRFIIFVLAFDSYACLRVLLYEQWLLMNELISKY